MDGLPGRALGAACLLLLAAGWLGPEAWGSPTPPPSPAAPPPPPPPGAPGGSQDTCTSCGGFRRPEELGRVDGDFLEAVKRHILSRLQMRGRPNITHAVPKAAMVTALRKLHAGKVREDGRVEIPHLDGHASPGADGQERVSEIISFAETGGSVPRAASCGPHSPPSSTPFSLPVLAAAASAPWGKRGLPALPFAPGPVHPVLVAVLFPQAAYPCSPVPATERLALHHCSEIGPQRLWARIPLPADACGPGSAGTCLVIA